MRVGRGGDSQRPSQRKSKCVCTFNGARPRPCLRRVTAEKLNALG